ncbi:MAG: hypothetical protein K0R37_1617, partial [Arthrobacter sp.]|nr:hypothetical protein [Arthrobacter sp.]
RFSRFKKCRETVFPPNYRTILKVLTTRVTYFVRSFPLVSGSFQATRVEMTRSTTT